jgi:cytochrome oxidase Cu insertion factor (SCO1/SenC/PrrC family)
MKIRIFLLTILTGLLFLAIPFLSRAQTSSMPAFKMQLSNGKTFTSSQLNHQKPTVLIYFAPDCEHCQVLMNEIFSRLNDFKTTQMVMVTFEPVKELFAFEKKYQTAKYPNIQVGSELPVFFFRYLYKLEHTPFTALFDKNGKLIASYKEQTPVNDLVKKLKALH